MPATAPRRRRRAPSWGIGVVRTADAVARHPTLLGLTVMAVGALLLIVGFLATTGPPLQEKYRLRIAVPADSPALRAGQAVRVGGRLAGLVSDVDMDAGRGGTMVTANITKSEFRPLPEDTRAYVRVHSIVSETYVELRPGTAERKLHDGDRVHAEATSGVDLLEVVRLFDRKTRQNLSRTTIASGVGVSGRGRDLNATIATLPPLATEATEQLDAVTRTPGALGRVISGGAATAQGLRGERPQDLAHLLDATAGVLTTTGRRTGELRQTLRALPPLEDELIATAPRVEPLLDDVAALSGDLRPVVRELSAQLPTLTTVLQRGKTLRTELTTLADAADPVLQAARPVAFDLFPVMTTLGPLNDDLRTLLTRVGPYRREYRIPGQPGVKKGSGEIAEAGRRFIDATNDPYAGGLAGGAPAWRVLPVLTPRPCQNPFPLPGEADRDTMAGSSKCVKGRER